MSGNEVVVLGPDMPVGLRFCPTEEEVFTHYLRLKLLGKDSEVDPYIAEVDILKLHPRELPRLSKLESNKNEWWFSSRRRYVSSNSKNSKRKAKNGYWKSTGRVKSYEGCNGRRRILTFHDETVKPAKRTGWVIHEYFHDQKPTCVICRLKFDPRKKGRKADPPESSDENRPAGLENQVASAVIPDQVHCHDEVNRQLFDSQAPYLPVSLFIEQMGSSLLDNEMQAPCGAEDESNKYFAEFENLINVGPGEDNYWATTDDLFNTSSLGPSIISDTDDLINERYTQTWKVHALLVHLLAQRKSGVCKWLIDQVKLYELLRVKISYKEILFPLVICVLKRMLWRPAAYEPEINCLISLSFFKWVRSEKNPTTEARFFYNSIWKQEKKLKLHD